MDMPKVGIRELRENLASYLEGGRSFAITRHDQTLGFFVPAQKRSRTEVVAAARAATEEFQRLINSWGATEEELMEEIKEIQKAERKARKHGIA